MRGFQQGRSRIAAQAARGFTLIELIVVITILGVLAAVALPRFTALQSDARKAKADAILGSMRAAAGVVKATAMVQGVNCSTASITGGVTLEGRAIDVEYCYPSASVTATAGILGAANVDPTLDGMSVVRDADTNTLTVRINMPGGATTCNITYQPPAAANGAPTFVNNATTGNC